MPRTLFISDTHIHHSNILKFEPEARDFSTLKEHDEFIVDTWNSHVNADDIIYHGGDVILSSTDYSILRRLNGRKRLILGNHDTPARVQAYAEYFEQISAYAEFYGKQLLFAHIPVHPSQFDSRFKAQIHGHVHSKSLSDPRYFNVSCEAINFIPIELGQIVKQLRAKGIDLQ